MSVIVANDMSVGDGTYCNDETFGGMTEDCVGGRERLSMALAMYCSRVIAEAFPSTIFRLVRRAVGGSGGSNGVTDRFVVAS